MSFSCTCNSRDTVHMSHCALAGSCRRGCPEGECYCSESTYREANDVCSGCGAHDGDCYCGED